MTITFMNTGEEMNETEKLPTSLVQNTTQGSLLCCSLMDEQPNGPSCLMDHLMSGKYISYGFLDLMDINGF